MSWKPQSWGSYSLRNLMIIFVQKRLIAMENYRILQAVIRPLNFDGILPYTAGNDGTRSAPAALHLVPRCFQSAPSCSPKIRLGMGILVNSLI